MALIRQGDILLVPATKPARVKQAKPVHGRLVLAEGEITGHAHTIMEQDGVRLVTQGEADELRMWLLVTTSEPVELEHDEHATLTVPPGVYEVTRQREYAPEAPIRVTD